MFGFTLSKDLKLGEIIAIASIVLILLGFYKIFNFYWLFGVDITPFLEPTEIIFSFAELTRIVVYPIFIAVLTPITIKFFNEIKQNGFKFRIHFFLLILLLFFIVIYIIFFSYIFTGSLFNLTILLILFFVFLPIIVWHSIRPITTYYAVVISILYIFESIHISNKIEHLNVVLFGQPEYSFEFFYENEEICTDNNLMFIGVTRNYIFLWDTPSQTVVTYSLKDLKRIKSKRLKYNKSEKVSLKEVYKYYRRTIRIY